MKIMHSLYFKMLICILTVGLTLFLYIDKLNDLTELRLAIPVLTKEVRILQAENMRLKYEIEQFESPIHLMELMRKPEFSHLHFPFLKDVVILPDEVMPSLEKK